MKKKFLDTNMTLAIGCMIVILIIISLSGSNLGWTIEKQAVSSIKLSDVVVTKLEGEPYGPGPGIPVYTIKITNSFIPRQYELPYVSACLYNSELKKSATADVRWDIDAATLQSMQNSIEVWTGTKTVTLLVYQGIRYAPKSPVAVPVTSTEPEVYDKMYVFFTGVTDVGRYYDCFTLTESDYAKAVMIPIEK